MSEIQKNEQVPNEGNQDVAKKTTNRSTLLREVYEKKISNLRDEEEKSRQERAQGIRMKLEKNGKTITGIRDYEMSQSNADLEAMRLLTQMGNSEVEAKNILLFNKQEEVQDDVVTGHENGEVQQKTSEEMYEEIIVDVEKLQAVKKLEGHKEEVKELNSLPYVKTRYTQELIDLPGTDEGTHWVGVDSIIGSVSLAFENWGSEYDGRKGLVSAIAEKLRKPTKESLENVFHLDEPHKGMVKVKKVSTPKGDLFVVVDGSHRVAGSKLSGIPKIPAQVERVVEPSVVKSADQLRMVEWKSRINRGLIAGVVEHQKNEKGETEFILHIKKQILPWLHLPGTSVRALNEVYFELYPDAKQNLRTVSGDTVKIEDVMN